MLGFQLPVGNADGDRIDGSCFTAAHTHRNDSPKENNADNNPWRFRFQRGEYLFIEGAPVFLWRRATFTERGFHVIHVRQRFASSKDADLARKLSHQTSIVVTGDGEVAGFEFQRYAMFQ